MNKPESISGGRPEKPRRPLKERLKGGLLFRYFRRKEGYPRRSADFLPSDTQSEEKNSTLE